MYPQLAYYYEHREYKLAYQKEYYQKNKEMITQYYKDYYNRKRINENQKKRRLLKKTSNYTIKTPSVPDYKPKGNNPLIVYFD